MNRLDEVRVLTHNVSRPSIGLCLLIAAAGCAAGDDDGAGDDGAMRDVPASPDGEATMDAGDPDAARDGGPRPDVYPAPSPRPADPTFPDVVGTLSFAIRTAGGEHAGTDDGVQLCLRDDLCFHPDTRDVNDREPGMVEVYHFEGVDIPRSEVDQVTLETRSTAADNDQWNPTCLHIRFDGEPVYCNDEIDARIGTGPGAGEVPSWTDPDGLHQACDTCQPSTLTHGPMQGAHDPDRLRIWVRTDATRTVGLRLDTDRDLSDAPVVAWAQPRPEDDFTAVLEAPGLEPDLAHSFRVEVDGTPQSPLLQARTAPRPGARVPVRLAFGSCSSHLDQPIFDHVSATDPDLFLMVGDNHYGNSRYVAAHRWHYRRFRTVRERASLMSRVPTLATWDDHDFVGNNSNRTCFGRDDALRGFKEYWANGSYGTPEQPGTFFTHRYGPLQLFVLDCRMERPEVGDDRKRCDVDSDAEDVPRSDGPLGPRQTSWLLGELEASGADFKLIACGSQFDPEGSLDSWAAFPEARAALFDELDARGIGGVALLAGDIHKSELRMIERSAGYALPELTSSPLANNSGACNTPTSGEIACLGETTSFMTVDVDPSLADPTLTAHIRGPEGDVRHELRVRRSDLTP